MAEDRLPYGSPQRNGWGRDAVNVLEDVVEGAVQLKKTGEQVGQVAQDGVLCRSRG